MVKRYEPVVPSSSLSSHAHHTDFISMPYNTRENALEGRPQRIEGEREMAVWCGGEKRVERKARAKRNVIYW